MLALSRLRDYMVLAWQYCPMVMTIQSESWTSDKCPAGWINAEGSLPEKQLSEQVNWMNWPTQTHGRIRSHWFYYIKDKVNAGIVKR